MALATVRPFSALRPQALAPLRPARCTRVLAAPMAKKGFGEPKNEPTPPPQQQGTGAGSSGRPGGGPDAPPPATPRGKVVRETPQVVVDRMFGRMLVCTGVPVFTGMAMFPLFYYLRVVQDIDYPLWIVYVAQVFTFGGGLLGITYGALSSSWDPNREGSALGWNEMRANLSILLSTRDNQQ